MRRWRSGLTATGTRVVMAELLLVEPRCSAFLLPRSILAQRSFRHLNRDAYAPPAQRVRASTQLFRNMERLNEGLIGGFVLRRYNLPLVTEHCTFVSTKFEAQPVPQRPRHRERASPASRSLGRIQPPAMPVDHAPARSHPAAP
jgi:hypothetical protein